MDVLHELIHSMTAPEKGFFKKHNNSRAGAEYILLFDAIAAMKEYDEAKLAARFRKTEKLKHLSKAKNYLHQALIRNLLIYHEHSSPQITLRTMINEIEMLMARGLLHQARKRADKARTLARDGQWFVQWLDILSYQGRLLDIRIYSPAELRSEDLMQETAEVSKRLANINELQRLNKEVDGIIRSSVLMRTDEIREKLDRILSHPLLQDESNVLSSAGRIMFCYINYLCHFISQDLSTAYKFAFRQYEMIKADAALQLSRPAALLDTYNVLLTSLQFMKDMPQFEKYLLELKQVPAKTTYLELVKFQYYSSFALAYYSRHHMSEAFSRDAAEVQRKLRLYRRGLKEDMRISLLLLLADGYVRFGKYEEAIDVIEDYRRQPPKDIRQDYQNYLMFFYLIAQYEMGNHQLVANLLGNAGRFMKRTGEFSEIDHLLLKVFNTALQVPDKRTRNAELLLLLEKIKEQARHAGRLWENYVVIITPFVEGMTRNQRYHQAISREED